MKKIHILIGLPGSGKSYFAREYQTYQDAVIDTDEIFYETEQEYYKLSKDPYNRIVDGLCGGYWISRNEIRAKNLIVDGLFVDKNSIVKIISAISEAIVYANVKSKNLFKSIPSDIILHYWNEDRENCSFNDKYGRMGFERTLSSETSIRNMDYIDLNNKEVLEDLINTILENQDEEIFKIENIKLQKHEVYKMDDNDRKIKKLTFKLNNPNIKDNILKSTSWCTGGAYGNCWDSTLSPVGADDPKEFDEFDEIMENLIPEVSFIKYKNIRNKCVKLDSMFESDYYGGGCTYEYWTCDLSKLVQLCKEYGYTIKED